MKPYHLFIALLFSFTLGYGQKFYIPDDNFRSCMIGLYPGAFDADDSLIIANAQGFSGNLECESMGIADLSGLEYFNKITILQLDDNIFPTFPDLTGFTDVQFISISDNKNIEEVPDLSGLTSLNRLDVYDNNIDSLPSFLALPDLRVLTLGLNPLKHFPQVPPTILTLAMNRTLLDSLPDLSVYPNLSGLYVKYVELTELPDLSSLTFNNLSVGFNFLSFEDLIPIVNTPNYAALIKPELGQLPFTLEGDSTIVEHTTLQLTFPEDENITTNRYVWYHDNVFYTETTERTLNVFDVDPSLSGQWRVEVFNSHLYFDSINYKLETYPINVEIIPCFDGTTIQAQTLDVHCPQGATVALEASKIKNYTAPLSVTIEGVTGTKNYTGTYLYDVQEDAYQVTLSDVNGCIYKAPMEMDIVTHCDNVFTPNGDGRNDFFKFELQGTVKIYSSNDQFITTLNNASHWDGKDQNGQVVPTGYYVLIDDNGNTQFVTVAH